MPERLNIRDKTELKDGSYLILAIKNEQQYVVQHLMPQVFLNDELIQEYVEDSLEKAQEVYHLLLEKMN